MKSGIITAQALLHSIDYLQVFQVGPHELEADGDPRRQSGRLQVLLELLVLPRIHERVGAQQRRKVGLKLKVETVNKYFNINKYTVQNTECISEIKAILLTRPNPARPKSGLLPDICCIAIIGYCDNRIS